jgi:hypothetical protein
MDFLDSVVIADVCGIARHPLGRFLITSGTGAVGPLGAETPYPVSQTAGTGTTTWSIWIGSHSLRIINEGRLPARSTRRRLQRERP